MMSKDDKMELLNNKYWISSQDLPAWRNFQNGGFIDEDGGVRECVIVSGAVESLTGYHQRWLIAADRMSLPVVLEFFIENDLAYLVVEKWNGTSWDDTIHSVFRRVGWWQLSYQRKSLLLSYMKTVLAIVQSLEALQEEVVVAPDLFLLHDKQIALSLLPDVLLWKNRGMFAPERNGYNLALMMMHCFTDLAPIKLDYLHPDRLRRSLLYFIADSELVDTVVRFLHPKASGTLTIQELTTQTFAFGRRISGDKLASNAFFFNASFDFRADLEQLVVKSVAAKELDISDVFDNKYAEGEDAFDVVSGLTGKCLSKLHKLSPTIFEPDLNDIDACFEILIDNQLPDGTWPGLLEPEKSSLACFATGVAGIAFVLWTRYMIKPDAKIQNAAVRAMAWLLLQPIEENGNCYWLRGDRQLTLRTTFFEGVAGIALCFIVAAEATGNEEYRAVAEKSLLALPDRIFMSRFGYWNGLAGLGDVYMEAWRVFGNPVWKTRAHIVAETLYYTGKLSENEGIVWEVDGEDTLDNSPLTGNEGILYFLSRYLKEAEDSRSFLWPHRMSPVILNTNGTSL